MEVAINSILAEMQPILKTSQLKRLKDALKHAFEPKQHENKRNFAADIPDSKGGRRLLTKDSSIL